MNSNYICKERGGGGGGGGGGKTVFEQKIICHS